MITFLAKSVDGNLNLGSEYNRARLKEWLKKNPDKYLKIEPVISKRTRSQNNFYWAYLGIIERETGQESTELHEHFKQYHLPKKWKLIFGKTTEIYKSTTELTKTEFADYLDKICAETNIPIPDPRQLENFITNY